MNEQILTLNEINVITPNHFLVGRAIPTLLFGDCNFEPEWEYVDEDYESVLTKTVEWRESVFRDWKERWVREYLLSLRERDRMKTHPVRKWNVGEVAFCKVPSKTKPYWPLVLITETFPDENEIVRTVKILKPDGKTVTVNVSHLIPLELFKELDMPQTLIESDEVEVNEARGASSEFIPSNEIDDEEDRMSILEDIQEFYDSVSEDQIEIQPRRPSCKTVLASRKLIRSLAKGGLA